MKGDQPMSTDDWRENAKRPIRRALISVYDKTGLVELAQGLTEAGIEIVSTGSTAKVIAEKGIPVTRVEELTGFPEVPDGRVKTLHPRVHAGLLADLRKPEHAAALEQLGIAAFELVVVNLYPFTETVDSGAGIDECVEQIDIGGPSMVRAAAKNHPSVAVVVDPLGYDGVLAAVRHGGFTLAERKGWRRWRFSTPPTTTSRWRRGWSRRWPRTSADHLPEVAGPQLAPLGDAALRREPAPAGVAVQRPGCLAGPGASRAAARKRDVLQQLHRCGRGLAGGLRP